MNIKQQGAEAITGRLDEIQQQMRDICRPQYDEYYKVTTEHGFTKITLPKKK